VQVATGGGSLLGSSIGPGATCTTPTTADACRSAYATGCWSSVSAACGPLLTQDLQTAVAAVADTDRTPFVLPSLLADTSGPAPAQEPLLQWMPTDHGSDTTSVSLFALGTLQPTPPPLTYTGAWLGSLLTATPSASFVADPWEADGTAVHTCAEYVYKKFYDYERFAKRAAAQCGTDGLCVYRLATSSPVAIDGAGVGRTLRQNSIARSPIAPTIRRQVGLVRDMQAPPVPIDRAVGAAVVASEISARDALGAAVPELANMLAQNPDFFVAAPKNPFFAYDVSFLRNNSRYGKDPSYTQGVEALVQRVEQARRYYAYPDEWAYHAARVAAQGDMTLAERDDIESRVRAYRAAIARFQSMIAARLQSQRGAMDQAASLFRQLHDRVPGNPDPLAHLGDARWIDVPMSVA
jgi:hypothetical protein